MEGGAVGIASTEASVVVMLGKGNPSLILAACDHRFTRLTLGFECVVVFIQTLVR